MSDKYSSRNIKQYTSELREMFETTAQISQPEKLIPNQQDLTTKIEANKPTYEQFKSKIKDSWNLDLRSPRDASKIIEKNQTILKLASMYSELLDRPEREGIIILDKSELGNIIIQNCFDNPTCNINYMPELIKGYPQNSKSKNNRVDDYTVKVDSCYQYNHPHDIVPLKTLMKVRKLKYQLLFCYLDMHGLKITNKQFKRVLDTTLSNADQYCTAYYHGTEEMLFLPMHLNKIDTDDIVKKYEDEAGIHCYSWKAGFIKEAVGNMNNKVSDYHAALKIEQAKSSILSVQLENKEHIAKFFPEKTIVALENEKQELTGNHITAPNNSPDIAA